MAKKKKMTAEEREELRWWVFREKDAGVGDTHIFRHARERYGAFDWSVIFAELIKLFMEWLKNRKK